MMHINTIDGLQDFYRKNRGGSGLVRQASDAYWWPRHRIQSCLWSGFKLAIPAALISVLITLCAAAQTPPLSLPPTPTPTPAPERKFLAHLLSDQRAIWTAPLHLRADSALWLAPLGFATAALIATDQRTTNELIEHGDNQTRLRISHDISRLGEFYTTGSAAAAFYLIGRVGKDARARETGLLGAEALIDSGIVATVIKAAMQRPRPPFDQGRGNFRDDGDSFPSGHAASAWALATVIAHEYQQRRWLAVSAYGLATAVSLARFTGRSHFLSDALVGSAIGYGIGHYVYHAHHDPSLDISKSTANRSAPKSNRFPWVTPSYSRGSRSYGLRLAWSF